MPTFFHYPLAATIALGIMSPLTVQASDPEQQLMELQSFQVIAHRGASGHAPEHTWTAYDKAVEMNADYLELDVHMSADGEMIAIHDDTLDRTTDGRGRVQDAGLDELRALDAGAWFNQAFPEMASDAYVGAELLTLNEVIDRYGNGIRYYIETKSPERYPELQHKLVNLLEEEGLIDSGSVIIQSFSQDSLQQVHSLNADIPLVQLLWYSPAENGEGLVEWTDVTPAPGSMADADFLAIADYAVGIGPNVSYEGEDVISADFIDQAHANGLLVHPYTINDSREMRRLIDWGVDGMFTNFPDRLSAELGR